MTIFGLFALLISGLASPFIFAPSSDRLVRAAVMALAVWRRPFDDPRSGRDHADRDTGGTTRLGIDAPRHYPAAVLVRRGFRPAGLVSARTAAPVESDDKGIAYHCRDGPGCA